MSLTLSRTPFIASLVLHCLDSFSNGYSFLLATALQMDIEKRYQTIEDVYAQADVVDGKYMQVGGNWNTEETKRAVADCLSLGKHVICYVANRLFVTLRTCYLLCCK